MAIKTKLKANNDGLSEVLGVIIIIAIVVILAAVIASNQYHIQSYSVAVTAYRLNDSTILINNVGGQDNAQLLDNTPFTITINDINCTYDGAVPTGVDIAVDPSGDENHWSLGKKVYSSITLTGNALLHTNGNAHIVVVGNFFDGAKITVLDTTV